MPSPTGRICFVTDDHAGIGRSGAIGTHSLLMSRLLAERGWDVHVLFCGAAEAGQAPAKSGTEQHAHESIFFASLAQEPAPAWNGVQSFGEGIGTLSTSQRAFEALERLHAKHRFDVIEFSDRNALGFRAVQAKRSGIAFADVRLAVKLHGATAWRRRGNLSLRRSPWELGVEHCERYAFEHSDLQLSPSRYMIADVRDHGWGVREDVVVAYPYPDPHKGLASQTSDIRELVFFGRLEPRKGLDLFLDALDQLSNDLPVLFLGRDGEIGGRDASDIVAERMVGRAHRIETGLDRDAAIAELHEDGRLAVLASRAESFGLTAAECIAGEIPFIAADAGGVAELVEHHDPRARCLFEPTVEGLVQALERRLISPAGEERDLRSAMAAACDPGCWNDRVEGTYRALLERSTLPPRHQEHVLADSTVTVAVTHYDHAEYLPAALASIANQTRAPDEVLVIDDGSTQEASRRVFAEQEARYPGWTFIRQPNGGPGAARNVCLAHCTSTYFLPFDSDNIAAPTLVETLLTAATADGRDAATCHILAFVDEQDIPAERFAFRYAPTGGPRLLTVLENVFGETSGLFRAEALRAVGGFETARWSPHEDWETYTKLALAGSCVDVVPRVLMFYRTEIGGRLSRLGTGPAHVYRLRQRMIRDLLADADLDREERILLWECLLGFAHPQADLVALQQAQDKLAHWAHKTIDEVNWRAAQLEELRELLTAQVDAATSRAERAEAELAALQAKRAQPAWILRRRR